MVQRDSIPDVIEEAIGDLGISSFLIGGGPASVSYDLEAGLANVLDRVYGADRYETSARIGEKYFPDSDKVFIASGQVWPDALVLGPIATKEDSPIILVQENSIPKAPREYLKSLRPEKIIVSGGGRTISEVVVDELKEK